MATQLVTNGAKFVRRENGCAERAILPEPRVKKEFPTSQYLPSAESIFLSAIITDAKAIEEMEESLKQYDAVVKAASYGDNILVIRDSSSMVAWRRQLYAPKPRNLPPVTFQLPELSSEQNRTVSARVRGYQQDCGCTSGGFFMSVTVVALLVSYFGSGGHLSNINLPHVLSFVGITVLAALSGKLLGLFWARWRLLRLATNVHNMIVRAKQRAVTASI